MLDSTKSGEHKVKLTGLMVSEEAGASRDLSLDGHQGAVENVASGAVLHAEVHSTCGRRDVCNHDGIVQFHLGRRALTSVLM